MKVIIDRIEGDCVVVELPNGNVVDIPKDVLPLEAKEGDIIEIIVSKKDTKDRKEKIEKLCEDLWD